MKTALLFLLALSSVAAYCSNETCRRCCTVSQTGCYNSFDE